MFQRPLLFGRVKQPEIADAIPCILDLVRPLQLFELVLSQHKRRRQGGNEDGAYDCDYGSSHAEDLPLIIGLLGVFERAFCPNRFGFVSDCLTDWGEGAAARAGEVPFL
jgi:hypothetical protein